MPGEKQIYNSSRRPFLSRAHQRVGVLEQAVGGVFDLSGISRLIQFYLRLHRDRMT
jgi:hypothetical protein